MKNDELIADFDKWWLDNSLVTVIGNIELRMYLGMTKDSAFKVWLASFEKFVSKLTPVAIADCHIVHSHMCQFLNRTRYGMDTISDGDNLYILPNKKE